MLSFVVHYLLSLLFDVNKICSCVTKLLLEIFLIRKLSCDRNGSLLQQSQQMEFPDIPDITPDMSGKFSYSIVVIVYSYNSLLLLYCANIRKSLYTTALK